MTEPTTAITDFILAAETAVLGALILRSREGKTSLPAKLWAFTLFSIAVSAAAGGAYHGFAVGIEPAGTVLWKTTVFAVGLTSVLMLAAATLAAFPAGVVRNVLLGAAVAQFVIYAGWMMFHDDFKYVILDYAPAMAVVLAIELRQLARRTPGAGSIAGGIVISFAAAGVQQSGFDLHPDFNHNDIYHVIEMIAMYFLYRGGARLRPA